MNTNIIRITNISQSEPNKITYDYEISGEWKKVFNMDNKFFIEYNFNVSNIPEEIKVIPLLSNILPIAWLYNAEIILEKVDKLFYECLSNVMQGYKNMYPMLDFKQNLSCNYVNECTYKNSNNVAILFSGGVDSYSTFIAHKDEKPTLITIWGSDIELEDISSWNIVKKGTELVANEYNLNTCYIKSNFRTFIDCYEIDKDIKNIAKDDWWHGFQHGLGILGQTSIIAYEKKLEKIYIASSHSKKEKNIKCASDPRIDNEIKFANCHVIHDQFEYTRQDKINSIINYYKDKEHKPILRVCWQKNANGENCSECEKCYRTIYGIIAANGNPNDYGFTYNVKKNRQIKNSIKYKIRLTDGQLPLWKQIQEEFLKNKNTFYNDRNYKWIYEIDFDNIEKNNLRKIRKGIGKCLRKLRIIKDK